MKKRSCAKYLHKLEKQFGYDDITEDDYDELIYPREVQLPTWSEDADGNITRVKDPDKRIRKMKKKQEKKSRKQKEKGEPEYTGPVLHIRTLEDIFKVTENTPVDQDDKYRIAYWYLEEFLKDEYRDKIYREHLDFDELVDYAFMSAIDNLQMMNMVKEENIDPSRVYPEMGYREDRYDIPDEHWKEFGKYCKKHPIHSAMEILPRRAKFMKHLRKKRRKYYSPKYIRHYDPMFAQDIKDRKEWVKNLKRIGKENEKRVDAFREFLDKLTMDQVTTPEVVMKFREQTEEMLAAGRRRVEQFIRETSGVTLPSLEIDFDDGPKTYIDELGTYV